MHAGYIHVHVVSNYHDLDYHMLKQADASIHVFIANPVLSTQLLAKYSLSPGSTENSPQIGRCSIQWSDSNHITKNFHYLFKHMIL